jgi:hypothetical protein
MLALVGHAAERRGTQGGDRETAACGDCRIVSPVYEWDGTVHVSVYMDGAEPALCIGTQRGKGEGTWITTG